MMKLVYAMGIGFFLDFMLGDPPFRLDPLRLIAALVRLLSGRPGGRRGRRGKKGRAEKKAGRKSPALECFRGLLVTLITLVLTGAGVLAARYLVYRFLPALGVWLDGILFYSCIAPRRLYQESMAVYYALPDQRKAKEALSAIDGRDTERLDERGILRAVVETIADNTPDGVTAPFFYMALGGPLLCFLYKAVHITASMLDCDKRYEDFRKAPSWLNKLCNWLPVRISAAFALPAAKLLSFVELLEKEEAHSRKREREKTGFDWKNTRTHYEWKRGLRICKRDRKKAKGSGLSPMQSVYAGALGIRLAGDVSYNGRLVRRPYLGDPIREIEKEDIKRANDLMYMTGALVFLTLLETLIWAARL